MTPRMMLSNTNHQRALARGVTDEDDVGSPVPSTLGFAPWQLLFSREGAASCESKEGARKSTARGRQCGPRCYCAGHCFFSFATRAALVVLMSASILGMALCVLRIYAAHVYGEAESLGMSLQSRRVLTAEAQMASWIDGMITGAVVLSSNLHRQGLVPLLLADPFNVKARRITWESFKSLPTCEHVFYATESGLTVYRRSEDQPLPILIQAKPVDPDLPYGNWSVRVIPVDPVLGEPMGPQTVPERPFLTLPAQPAFRAGLKVPPGTISWSLGLQLLKTGETPMHYSATGPLMLTDEGQPGLGGRGLESNSSSTAGSEGFKAIGVTGVVQSMQSVSGGAGSSHFEGGCVFFSRASDGEMVFASKGSLLKQADGVEVPSPLTAEMSDDPIIRAAAQHLRAAFPLIPASAAPGDVSSGGVPDDHASAAARSGLCWERYFKLIDIDGQLWYLNCAGRVYGGTEGQLAFVGVHLVPRQSIMGPIAEEKHRASLTVVGVAGAIAIIGVVGVLIVTVFVDQMAATKQALEGKAEKQEGKIQNMAKELDMVRSLLSGGSAHALDMRTPMEMLHDLLGELTEKNTLPSPEALLQIQALLKMPEPHLPILLQQSLGQRVGSQGGPALELPSDGVEASGKVLDTEMAAWLRSSVLRLPKPAWTATDTLPGTRRNSEDSSQGSLLHLRSIIQENSHDSRAEIFGQVMQVEGISDDAPLGGERYVMGIRQPVPEDSHEGGDINTILAMGPASAAALTGLQEMRVALERVGEWNFDTWGFASVSSGRPITWIGLELYRRAGSMRAFHLPMERLVPFLAKLDEGMPGNGYHNSTHIADVANSLYHLIKFSGLAAYLSQLDILAAITAALVHDFRHPGLNNDFVVKAADEMALRYNDRTVLENFHVAEAFLLMTDDKLNFLGALNAEDYRYVRNVIIELVLGSDLKRHFELVEAFKKRAKDKESPLSKSNEGDRLLLMQVALKVADIGHAAKKLAIHKKWTDAITEEFYLQGDKERAAGFKVSPFMDRENNNLAKSQVYLVTSPAC
eukprot:jgi/Mesvir1/18445/Mv14303-RA.6